LIPSRNFPLGALKLVEFRDKSIVKVHVELSNSSSDRKRIQNLRNDLLMSNPRLDLQIIENNAL
jgi:hypothetical protein